jgi:phosphate transport system substrate-binding protein
MTRPRIALALMLLVVLTTQCAQPTTQHAPVLLRLSGSTSMQLLLRELATAYSARNKYVTFEFSLVGSTAGLEALRRGSADLAMVSREWQPNEGQDLSTSQQVLIPTVIAYDAVAVIVNETNPVRRLSIYQLRNLFEGQTLNWEELGGTAGDVVVLSREDGSGTRDVFEGLIMNGHHVTSMALVLPGSEAMRDYVAKHENAVGYLSSAYLGSGVAAISIDNAAPERSKIEDGSYPLARPFLLVTQENPTSEAASFVQFALSPAGQAIVRKTYGGASSGSRRQPS